MRKLSLSLIFVVLISVVGLGWLINAVYSYTSDKQPERTRQNAAVIPLHHIALTLNTLPSEGRNAFISAWNRQLSESASLINVEDLPLPDVLAGQLQRGEGVVLESDSGIDAYFLLQNPEKILVLPMNRFITPPKESRIELLLTLCFYGGITSIVLIWIWPLVHNLDNLRKSAIRFGQGQLQTRANTGRISYIRDIETEFNAMANRIDSLISDNKLLSRAVSHDLKTPLARLRFGLDALTDTRDAEKKERYYERVNRDLEEMESLIDTLLQYARLDETHISLSSKPLNMLALISKLINGHSDSDIDIRIANSDESIELRADPRYLSMLINNILSNACRHAKREVLVTLSQADKYIALCIEDDGQGIPLDERSNVTKPFWRGTTSRKQRGHGMGMAIVERIAAWHKAELEIDQSRDLGGAKITLKFQFQDGVVHA